METLNNKLIVKSDELQAKTTTCSQQPKHHIVSKQANLLQMSILNTVYTVNSLISWLENTGET